MTDTQRENIIAFHLKMAKAFRAVGKDAKAEQAEAKAKQLQK